MRPLMKLFKEKKGINVKTVDLYINMYSSFKKKHFNLKIFKLYMYLKQIKIDLQLLSVFSCDEII